MFKAGTGTEAGMTAGVGLTTATTRVILGMADEPGGRADQIAQRLGRAIRLGLVLDGERLPPEPQLAEQLGIATVTLREAVALSLNIDPSKSRELLGFGERKCSKNGWRWQSAALATTCPDL